MEQYEHANLLFKFVTIASLLIVFLNIFPACKYFSFSLGISMYLNGISNRDSLLAILAVVSTDFFLPFLVMVNIFELKGCYTAYIQNSMNDGCMQGEIISFKFCPLANLLFVGWSLSKSIVSAR